MELLGDVGQVEACLDPFGDSVNHDARQAHGLCRACHRLANCFGRTRSNS
jgi:hypothetical protein